MREDVIVGVCIALIGLVLSWRVLKRRTSPSKERKGPQPGSDQDGVFDVSNPASQFSSMNPFSLWNFWDLW